MAAESVVIVGAARTAIGALNGSLSTVPAYKLGAVCIASALQRAGVAPDDVDEVILGQVLTGAAGQNPARQAALEAGIPKEKTASTVNMVCGSGLRAVVQGVHAVRSGDAAVVVAGGQESMSLAPHAVHMRSGTKMGSATLVDTMVVDGLTDARHGILMGVTGENVAKQWAISRAMQDEFALQSQLKAEAAMAAGTFRAEIAPVVVKGRRGDVTVSEDEQPRKGTTFEALQALRPAFLTDGSGSVTAGNSSTLNDGAACVVLMTAAEAKRRGLTPLARVVSWGQAGVDPTIMGTGSIPAARKALERAGWTADDLDLVECNEAFASQSIVVMRELGLPGSKVNVNGGAIALGHPIGASGCRILVTLLHELRRADKRRGLAALCIGGGMGIAMCIERV